MRLRHALAVISVAALASLVPAAAHTQATSLVGTVGTDDAFVIDLRDSAGNPVAQLDPGTYTILIRDRSAFHNYHLTGPGVDMSTEVGFVGEVTWAVTLRDGVYRFVCDPHIPQMNGSFRVGAPAPAAPQPLAASVGPGKRIALRNAAGARVTKLAAGRYVVTVRDRTKRDNFRLRGPGVNRATGVRFVGRSKWMLSLRAGRYTFRSDRTRALRGGFTVTS